MFQNATVDNNEQIDPQIRSLDLPSSALEQNSLVNELALPKPDSRQHVASTQATKKRKRGSHEDLGGVNERRSAERASTARADIALKPQKESIPQESRSNKTKIPDTLSRPPSKALKQARTGKSMTQDEAAAFEFEGSNSPQSRRTRKVKESQPSASTNKASAKRGRAPKQGVAASKSESAEVNHISHRDEVSTRQTRQAKASRSQETNPDKGPEKADTEEVDKPADGDTSADDGDDDDSEEQEDNREESNIDDVPAEAQDGNEAVDPVLLGQDRIWSEIYTAAEENCTEDEFVAIQSQSGERPKLKLLRDFCASVQDLRDRYESIKIGRKADASNAKKDPQLASLLTQVSDRVHHFKDFDAQKPASKKEKETARKVIRGIYLWAAPAMVYLLKICMNCHFQEASGDYNAAGCREVLQLLDLTITLCETASNWTLKPLSDKPIVKSIKSGVLPRLKKTLRPILASHLGYLAFVEKTKFNEEQAAKKARNQKTFSSGFDVSHSLRTMNEEYEQIRCDPFRYSQPSQAVREPDAGGETEQDQRSDDWRDEEQKELVRQLLNKRHRGLPARSRYLQILNAPLLQNKLPTHVRDRALELKPYLIDQIGERNFIRSIIYVNFDGPQGEMQDDIDTYQAMSDY